MTTDSEPPPPTREATSSALAMARGGLPYPLWMLCGLGALSGFLWIGALALDFLASSSLLLPVWGRDAIHALLVLVIPAIVILFVRSRRLLARRHALAFFTLEGLLLLVVAIPSLLPYAAPTDLLTLPLRVPTLGLGVALAAVDPLVVERWRANRQRDSSTAVAAGVGFGAVVVVVAIILLRITPEDCTGGKLACGGLASMVRAMFCLSAAVYALAGVFGAWLGHALGSVIARSDRWL